MKDFTQEALSKATEIRKEEIKKQEKPQEFLHDDWTPKAFTWAYLIDVDIYVTHWTNEIYLDKTFSDWAMHSLRIELPTPVVSW